MSDTLLEPEDQIVTDYCDECKGRPHAPWCSKYAAKRSMSEIAFGKHAFAASPSNPVSCLTCGALLSDSAHTNVIAHEPAARGGGDEWRRYMKEAKELAESNHRIYGTQLSEAFLSAVIATVNESINQHHSLVAERESYAQLLKAAKSLIAMNNCNYGRSAMRERGGFIELEKAVEAVEQRSTSE